MKSTFSRKLIQTTPFPNILIDEVMPFLKDTSWRVLCVVVRQTLGWHDKTSGRRKERDWLTRSQLKARTGRNAEALSAAIDALVKQGYIDVQDSEGKTLISPAARRKNRGRIYYSLAVYWRQRIENFSSSKDMRFSTSSEKPKALTSIASSVFRPTQRKIEHDVADKSNTTKEIFTKENTVALSQGFLHEGNLSQSAQGFITLFRHMAEHTSKHQVDYALTVNDVGRLEKLLSSRSSPDWSPILELFFRSELDHIQQRHYSLQAFLNSCHIFMLQKERQ